MFAVIECGTDDLQLRWPFEGKTITRDIIGIVCVSIDLLIMTLFMLALWYIQSGVKRDTEIYRKKMYETK
jgi:hypothetical protein